MNDFQNVKRHLERMERSLHVIECNATAIGDWLPKKTVLRFFDLGDTQLRALEKEHALEFAVIGRRKFYSKNSILTLINKKKK